MTAAPPAEISSGRQAPRWMWIALILSLALNLLIVGMAATAMLHFRKGAGGNFIQSLSDDRRAVLKPLLAAQRKAVRPLRRKSREARRQAREVLSAEPFDREKLAAAYQAASDARIALDKARGEWLIKLAEAMTTEERREFLEWRGGHERQRRRWRRRSDSE